MKLIEYSLKRNNSYLFKDVDIIFDDGKINHLLGENGSGKSTFAKSLIGVMDHEGKVEDITEPLVVLGSYTNLPQNLTKDELVEVAFATSSNSNLFAKLESILNIESIPNNKLSKMSDGQKQKMKLLFFLSLDPKTLILDEFTSGLDRKTINEIYDFLNKYIKENEITIINITHNLEDLQVIPGSYYLIREKDIIKFEDKNEVISAYTGRRDLLV
ncbi:MAG: ATP-binding cassette domain-containing protein [Finegoldia sp.]|nr:ATP-binding cassette domain-containing protein [Finegoldia sp.]